MAWHGVGHGIAERGVERGLDLACGIVFWFLAGLEWIGKGWDAVVKVYSNYGGGV